MKIKTALRRRILELCFERGISTTELSRRSGMRHTTISNIMRGRNNTTTLHTLQRICEGLDITIPDFFDSDLFRDLDWEIQ